MPIPATNQDLVHGVDFTGAITGTAAEHNQLLDLSVPYTDGANAEEGIGFIITTTDTAAGVPSVPDPTQSANYTKWKRYVWNRRPFAAPWVPSTYMWIEGTASIATYLKWVLLDPASFATVAGATGTASPLQNALTYLNTQIGIAVAAANAAQGTANTATTNIGTMVGAQTLQAQITSASGSISTASAKMTAVYTAISGDATNIAASGGINGQLADLQRQITAGLAGYKSITNVTPSAIIGSFVRTNAAATAAEWYDPSTEHYIVTASGPVTLSKGTTTALTLDAAVTIPAGYYKVTGALCAKIDLVSTASQEITAVLKLAGTTALSFFAYPVDALGVSHQKFTATIQILGYISIPKATGSQAIAVEVTIPDDGTTATFDFTTAATSKFLIITLERLYLPQA